MRVPNVPDDLEAEAEKRARLVTNNSSLSRLFRSASSAAQDGASTPQQVEHAVRKSESGTSIHHATRSTSSLENVHNDNGQSYGLWRSLSTRLFGGPPQNRRLRSIGVTPTGERQARRQAALKDRRAAIAQSRRGANIHPQTHTPHTTSTIASSSTLEDSTPAAQGTYARQHVAERISLDSSVPRRRLHDERGDSHIDRFTSRSRYENELSGHTKIDETMQRSRAGGVSVKDLTDQDGETASHMADRRLERRSQHIWSTLERRFTPDEVERLRRMTSGINRLGESSSSSMTRSRSSAQGQNYDGHTSPAGSLTRIHQNSYPSRLQTTTQAYTPGLGWFAHRTSSATARDRRHGAVAAAVGAQVDRSRQQELDRLNHLDSGFSHPDHEYPRFRSDADIAALHGWHHTPSTSRSPIAPDSPQSGRRASSSSTPYERLMASHGGRHGEPHTVSTSSTQTESGNLRPNRGASPGSGSTPYERLMASYGESSVHSIHRGQEQLRENARPVTRHGRPKMDLDSHDVPHHQEEDDGRMEGQLHPAAWRVDEMTGDSANDIHHEMAHGVRAERHPDFVHKPGATGWALSKHRLSRRNSGDDIARVKGEDGRRDFSSSQAKLALEKRGLLGELFGCFRSSSGCGVGSYSRKAQQPHTPGPSEPGFPKPAEWARAELHTGDVPRRLEPQKSFDVKGLPMYAKLQQWRAEESAALGKGKATMPSSSHSPPRASLAEASHGEWRDDPDTMIVHKDSLRERTSTSQRRALPSEQAGSSAPTHTRRPSFDPDSIYIHKSMLPEVPHNLAGDPRMMLHSGSLRQLQGSSSGRRSFSRSSSRSSRGG
ncbi:hypothetical protein IE81DRAFT_112190 [Ceraceosorus guamensis]|uniref:Uncharacterized protein n=1 Tax=Ceraceosorus guamensis TaxID=1522189 RepID=A0A316W2A5_9BASI|nr:hypothetical protein IE81DRAFT_112190 [Ceraceosorus guamensis]PWN42903.1 hypothetical protein IE81DRAFT_112190 [Ceraceosorus guamensis]